MIIDLVPPWKHGFPQLALPFLLDIPPRAALTYSLGGLHHCHLHPTRVGNFSHGEERSRVGGGRTWVLMHRARCLLSRARPPARRLASSPRCMLLEGDGAQLRTDLQMRAACAVASVQLQKGVLQLGGNLKKTNKQTHKTNIYHLPPVTHARMHARRSLQRWM